MPHQRQAADVTALLTRIEQGQAEMLALLRSLVQRPGGCSMCGVPKDLHNTNQFIGHLFMERR